MAPRGHLIVLGAGITGLTSCLRLLEAGYEVTVIAKTLPPEAGAEVIPDQAGEYASAWAGAHWRTHAKKDDIEQKAWDLETYVAWMKLVKAEEAREAQGEVLKSEEKSGIAIRPSTITWSTPSHLELRPSGSPTSLWWSKHVQDFTLLAPTSISFTAFAVNVPQHLIHLHERIRSHTNARIIQADLPLSSGLAATIREAQSLAGISSSQALSVINALGLSARHLYLPASTSPDPAEAARLHPIRGQTVLVRGELAEIRTLQSYNEKTGETEITYAIPRPGSGTTVLGGCNVKDEWSTAVDEEMTEGILKRARVLVPELLVGGKEGKGGDWDKRFDVIKAQVGLRPGRVGGARVEGEVVSLGDSGEVLIVHAYGMAGAGFQNSVGVASKVLALVEEGLAG